MRVTCILRVKRPTIGHATVPPPPPPPPPLYTHNILYAALQEMHCWFCMGPQLPTHSKLDLLSQMG